jgi:hypothetical protein
MLGVSSQPTVSLTRLQNNLQHKNVAAPKGHYPWNGNGKMSYGGFSGAYNYMIFGRWSSYLRKASFVFFPTLKTFI